MASNIPSREDVIERAQALVPVLASRAEEAERARRVPVQTIADLAEHGLLKLCMPRRYGGFEMGWDVLCEVSQTLAHGDGSQAWVQNILCDHSQMVASMGPEMQEEVWGEDPETRISASFAPVGVAKPAKGGVVYSGRHGYSSGIDHVRWTICGGHILADGEKPKRCYFLLPKKDLKVIDDWQVMGLAGTGSKSFEAQDCFVPAHRILANEDAENGTGPGAALNAGPVFRLPRGGITATGFAALVVGIAEGFLANYVAYTAPRTSRGIAVAGLSGTQIAAGSASAEIEAARLLYLAPARDTMAAIARGETVTPAFKARARRDASFAAQLALGAVQRLFNQAGGGALFTSSAMQRQFRDIAAAAAHHAISWDNAAGDYGRVLLGM